MPAWHAACAGKHAHWRAVNHGPRDDSAGIAAFGIGHNGGPPLDPGAGWRHFCWKKAHARAWKAPPREIALARLARAEALGMSYREYTAVILDRGTHL